MTDATERSDVEVPSELAVRPACQEDLDAFLELVRSCVTAAGRSFNADEARWLFAGIPRADPAIHLLFDGLEPVGFTIVRTSCTPLTRIPGMHQEVVFVREDKRTKAAEMLLHLMTLEVFKGMPLHSEITLLVNPGPTASQVVEELQRMGFGDLELKLKAVRLPPKQIANGLEDAKDGATLH